MLNIIITFTKYEQYLVYVMFIVDGGYLFIEPHIHNIVYNSYKKDGYRQRNVRQFLQSAYYLATTRESRRYVVAFSRFAGAFGYVKRV